MVDLDVVIWIRQTMITPKSFLSHIFILIFLTSCETIKEMSGLTKPEIDDDIVNQTPDLILPPDFGSLPTQNQAKEIQNKYIEEEIIDPNLGYTNQQFVEPEIRNFVPSIQNLPPTPNSPSDSIEKFRKRKDFTVGQWVYQKSVNEFLQQNLFYFPRIDKGYNFSRRYIPQQNNSENFDVQRKQEKFVGEKNYDLNDIEAVPISK